MQTAIRTASDFLCQTAAMVREGDSDWTAEQVADFLVILGSLIEDAAAALGEPS